MTSQPQEAKLSKFYPDEIQKENKRSEEQPNEGQFAYTANMIAE